MSILFAVGIGVILGIILSVFLAINHVTKIIHVMLGAAHFYFVHHVGVTVGIDFIDAAIVGFYMFDVFAVVSLFEELGCLAEMLGFDTGSKPSRTPVQSTFMGELVGMLMSFFR